MTNHDFDNSRLGQPRSAERFEDTQALERLQVVLQAFERGIDAKDAAFYHGTSWDALEALLAAGVLLPGLGGDCGPAIYFAPKPSMFSIENPKCELPVSDAEALEMATRYAECIASRHALVRKLAWDYASPIDQNLAAVIMGDIPFLSFDKSMDRDSLLHRGINEKTALALSSEFSECYDDAVVLVFSHRLTQAFEVHEAEPNDDGVRIFTQIGIPVEFLVGIEPIGQVAYDKLEMLQRRFRR